MAGIVLGPISWAGGIDSESHREYNIDWLVHVTDVNDGPGQALYAAGLPTVGASWSIGNDSDIYARRWPTQTAVRADDRPNEKGDLWTVSQLFTTRPLNRCQDEQFEDPLMEPFRISGSFQKVTKQASFDRFGRPLLTSSHERLTGRDVEFDDHRPTVRIVNNVGVLPLAQLTQYMNTVNDAPMWGVERRMIKLSGITYADNYFGTCSRYYTITREFDVNFDTFDRFISDEGSKVLIEGGDVNNPEHFEQAKDCRGENVRKPLDGAGKPVTDIMAAPKRKLEYYPERNFALLNLPTTL